MIKVYVVPENDSAKAKAKAWLHNRKVDAQCLWADHKEEILILGPAAIGAISVGVKVIGKRINLHKEEQLKDFRVYDTSLGHYWELRKKLSNSQWLEIERRRGAGESLGDILYDMKVLK